MIRSERLKTGVLIAVLTICGARPLVALPLQRTASFASCSSNEDNATEQSNITTIADKVWAFSQTHPDGFTINVRTMTEPTEGTDWRYSYSHQWQSSRDPGSRHNPLWYYWWLQAVIILWTRWNILGLWYWCRKRNSTKVRSRYRIQKDLMAYIDSRRTYRASNIRPCHWWNYYNRYQMGNNANERRLSG